MNATQASEGLSHKCVRVASQLDPQAPGADSTSDMDLSDWRSLDQDDGVWDVTSEPGHVGLRGASGRAKGFGRYRYINIRESPSTASLCSAYWWSTCYAFVIQNDPFVKSNR
jgi:hypothetical protein